jgi:hypothetical protein
MQRIHNFMIRRCKGASLSAACALIAISLTLPGVSAAAEPSRPIAVPVRLPPVFRVAATAPTKPLPPRQPEFFTLLGGDELRWFEASPKVGLDLGGPAGGTTRIGGWIGVGSGRGGLAQ